MKFVNIFLILLINCGLFGFIECVRFYEYPIPIPVNSPGSSARSARHYPKNVHGAFNDPAVQFLVNNDQDGSYHFGYDTGGVSPTSYREEKRDSSGRIYGRFGYIDPEGFLRITEYEAGDEGFRSTESKRVLFDTSNLQLIGPIPKPFNELYKPKRTSAKQKNFY